MNKQAREIWASPQGGSLMKVFLGMQEKTPLDQQTIQKLREADPPKMDKQTANDKPT